MTTVTTPSPAYDVAVPRGPVQPGTLAHRRDVETRETGDHTWDGKPITVKVTVAKCTRADAVELSYGWAAHLGAILCPDCFGGGAA